jgi:hypothetical protein
MFGLVTGGAFIMMAGIVIGVKLLATNTPTAAAPSVAALPPGAEARALSDEDVSARNVVVLDEEAIVPEDGVEGEPAKAANTTAPRKAAAAPAAPNNGKKLSAEEQALLARMGGGLDQGPSKLRASSSASADSSGGGAGLTAAALRSVVTKGQPQLQRCYETALRGNPSQEAIRLDVDVVIGASGKVTEVKTRGRDFGNMAQCIQRTVQMWRFPASSDSTHTSFPVVFQPGA